MNQIKQLNIKNAEAYELAAELSAMTGESLTAVVTEALKEKVAKERKLRDREGYIKRLLAYGERYSKLPPSGRTEDDILDYDENGLPR